MWLVTANVSLVEAMLTEQAISPAQSIGIATACWNVTNSVCASITQGKWKAAIATIAAFASPKEDTEESSRKRQRLMLQNSPFYREESKYGVDLERYITAVEQSVELPR